MRYAGKTDIVVNKDYLYYPAWLKCEYINDRTFLSTSRKRLTDAEMSQTILQMFVNPIKPVRDLLRLSERILFQRQYRLGIQLRLGGKHAATTEKYRGVPFKKFPEIAKQLMNHIHKHEIACNDTVIYISSDAPDSIIELKKYLHPDVLVVDFPFFQYGHSDQKVNHRHPHRVIVNRILADMYMMNKCDFIFVSWQSSLGRLMCTMRLDKQCGKVLNFNKVSKWVQWK